MRDAAGMAEARDARVRATWRLVCRTHGAKVTLYLAGKPARGWRGWCSCGKRLHMEPIR